MAQATSTAIARKDENVLIPMIKKSIESFALNIDADKWGGYMLSAVMKNPNLGKCTPESLVGSLMILAAVGLPPVAGLASLIPYRNNKTGRDEAHAQFEYKGVCQIFYRDNNALSISAEEVHEAEITSGNFQLDMGAINPVKHIKMLVGDKGPVVGYYAVAHLKGGTSKAVWLTTEEIITHAKQHSKGYSYTDGAWQKSFGEMAKKTLILRLCKTLPMSLETRRYLSADETSRSIIPGAKSPFDLPDTTEWGTAEIETFPVVEPVVESKAEAVTEEAKDNKSSKEHIAEPKEQASDTLEAEILLISLKQNKKGGYYFAYKVDHEDNQFYVNMSCKVDSVSKCKAGDSVVFIGVRADKVGEKTFRWANDIEVVISSEKAPF